nr:MAG TPA: hypothetical protein [Caudoviricetes sp.]
MIKKKSRPAPDNLHLRLHEIKKAAPPEAAAGCLSPSLNFRYRFIIILSVKQRV